MALPTQPAELSEKLRALQNDILRKVEADLRELQTTIVREVHSHGSGNRRQTRHGKPATTTSGAEPLLENFISEKLTEFGEAFSHDLNTQFNRCFSLVLPASDRNGGVTGDPIVSEHAKGRIAASDKPTDKPTARNPREGYGTDIAGDPPLETEKHPGILARRGQLSNNQREALPTSEHDLQPGGQGIETTSSNAPSLSTSTTGKSSNKPTSAKVVRSTRFGRVPASSIDRATVMRNAELLPEDHIALEKVPCTQGDSGFSVDPHDPRNRTSRTSGLRTNTITAPPAPTQRRALPVARKRGPEPLAMVAERKRPKQTTDLEHIAASLVNASSVRQFMTHVSIWKVNNLRINKDDLKALGSWDERAAQYYKLGETLGKSSKLHKLLSLIFDVQVAQEIDDKLESLGYRNAPPDLMDEVLRRLEPAVVTKKQLQDRLVLPRKFMQIFVSHDGGLLSFLPLDDASVPLSDYKHMSRDVCTNLHTMIQTNKYATALAKTGSLFQRSILDCTKFPDMLWERIDAEELDELSLDCLTQLLDVQYRDENIVATPDWEKPDGWLGDWPANADSLPTGTKCAVCSSEACACIQGYFSRIPRVSSYGRKGLGLQAVATGELAYKKDQPIGEVVGCIVAPGRYKDGYSLDLIRSDLEGEPIVGQIYTGRESNLLRFINHRCRHPSAEVRGKAISQRYRMVVYALRDIRNKEEITVNWGAGFLGGKRCLCEDCEVGYKHTNGAGPK